MTVTDYPDYATSQDHANKIAATGAPLLALKTIVAQNQLGLSIPATITSNITPNALLNQISYELLLILATAAGTASPVTVVVQWSDSVTGQVTDAQDYSMFAGTSLNPHNVRITGPSNADTLNLFVGAGANAITLFFTVLQSSRVYSRHFAHTLTTNRTQPVFPGFTYALGDMSANIISNEADSVPASSNVQRLLPLYTGTARFWGRGSLNTGSDSTWRLNYSTLLVPSGDLIPYIGQGNSGYSPNGQPSLEIQNVAMPRSQLVLQLSNNNTTTANSMVGQLVAQELDR